MGFDSREFNLENPKKNKSVWICFDSEGYEVVGVYESQAEAQRHMIDAYLQELKREQRNGHELNYDDLSYDLETMLNGYIEDFFYIEEHEIKKEFDRF